MIVPYDSFFCLFCSCRDRPGRNQYKAAPIEARQRRTACFVEESHQSAAAAHTHGEGECKASRYLSGTFSTELHDKQSQMKQKI